MKLAFQAVLLASDTGSRLYPLNSPATPKALLPIGNKAMLSFPLAMLEAGGVAHVLIVRPSAVHLAHAAVFHRSVCLPY